MWLLAASVLLGALRAGSAQLILTGTDIVEKNDCNETVILPCYVTNLRENNENVMFVTWKKEKKVIFSFRGGKNEFYKDPSFLSAKLVSQADLTKGVASLVLSTAQATVGNYSCEVTESNREGETRMELRQSSVVSCGEENTTPKEAVLLVVPQAHQLVVPEINTNISSAPVEVKTSSLENVKVTGNTEKVGCHTHDQGEDYIGSWFLIVERAIIISLLCIVVILCAAQLIVIVLKYETESQRRVCIIVPVVIFVAVAGVGTALFFQDGYTAQNQAGLGLIVVPAVILVPFQYFMFGIVFDSLPQTTLALIGLKILGYIIAVVGFALCVPACPPLHASVLIAGFAIMATASLLSLVYVFIMGSRMKDHPRPGKAVEEPLNDAKGVMLE